MRILYISCVLFLFSCNPSKWETIKGSGIDIDPKSIDPIYFENSDKGIVGGYILVKGDNLKNYGGLEAIPILYLTDNGGQIWNQVEIDSKLKGRITNVYLHNDTLICTKEDSVILFSADKGKTVDYIKNTDKYKIIEKQYFNFNRYNINNHDFKFENIKYYIKEYYQNKFSTVIVCFGPESLTDYYFVSFDSGQNWKYLQKDYGSARDKYLYEDKYLFAYNYPFGLNRLKLK